MTERTKVRVIFTEDQMDSLQELMKLEGTIAGFLEVWHIILGHSLEDHEGDVTPWDYEIPKEQATELSKTLIEVGGVEAGLMWMNNGPSNYEEL